MQENVQVKQPITHKATMNNRELGQREKLVLWAVGAALLLLGLFILIVGSILPYLEALDNERWKDSEAIVSAVVGIVFSLILIAIGGVAIVITLQKNDDVFDTCFPEWIAQRALQQTFTSQRPKYLSLILKIATSLGFCSASGYFFFLDTKNIAAIAIFCVGFVALLTFCVAFLKQILAPRVRIVLENAHIHTGESCQLRIEKSGRKSALSVSLIGKERVSFGTGTDTQYDEAIFYQKSKAIEGSTSLNFTIPSKAMHTFNAPNNRVIWSLEVKQGKFFRESFTLTVYP